MNNRIAECRKAKGLTLKKLGEMAGVRDNTISQYETGKREPKMAMWEKLSRALEVSIPYLQGIATDPDALDLWEKNTGDSQEAIQAEMKRRKMVGRVSGDESPQELIGKAVANLEGKGETDQAAIYMVNNTLRELTDSVMDYYLDPKKVSKLPKVGNSPIFKGDMKQYFYDDMDTETYNQIYSILKEARDKLLRIKKK